MQAAYGSYYLLLSMAYVSAGSRRLISPGDSLTCVILRNPSEQFRSAQQSFYKFQLLFSVNLYRLLQMQYFALFVIALWCGSSPGKLA